MSSPIRILMVMDSCRVEPTRPSPHSTSQQRPFTESSTIALLYMGHTAEEKPSARPSRPRIRRTYQKFATRIARSGKTIPMMAMICRDYASTSRPAQTVFIPHLFEIHTPRGDPIVANTKMVEVNKPYSFISLAHITPDTEKEGSYRTP